MATDQSFADRQRSPEAQALLACLHLTTDLIERAPFDQFDPAQWEALLTLARVQRVRPIVHQALQRSQRWTLMPERLWRTLENECRNIAMKNMRLHGETTRILDALQPAGITPVILKGAALGPLVYGGLALRELGDIDFMVPRNRAEETVRTILALGYDTIDPLPVDWHHTSRHHAALRGPHGTVIEVHWALAPAGEPGAEVTDALWSQVQPFTLNDRPVFQLSPVDQLLHICIHAAYQHRMEFGLRPSFDIQRLIAHLGPHLNWNVVIERAEERRWLPGVSIALWVAHKLVGAAIPESALTQLQPPPTVLEVAQRMTWMTPDEGRVPLAISDISRETSIKKRLALVGGRLFISRKEIAQFYGVPQTRAAWPLLYCRRAAYLLQRYLRLTHTHITATEDGSRDVADHRAALRAWISQR